MPVEADYLGMHLLIQDDDAENLAYFAHCARHDFHLQACTACDMLRYPPTTGCPFCGAAEATWRQVAGEGAVHSLTVVHHAIQPGFRTYSPYAVLLVELDTQRGQPGEGDGIRMIGNLVTPDGRLAPPELVRHAAIGTRVRMTFTDLADGLSLPQWMLVEDEP